VQGAFHTHIRAHVLARTAFAVQTTQLHRVCLQATFLRGSSSGAVNEQLESELEKLDEEELETKCRRSGVSRKGGRQAQVSIHLQNDAH
jgi:hypothetical protein